MKELSEIRADLEALSAVMTTSVSRSIEKRALLWFRNRVPLFLAMMRHYEADAAYQREGLRSSAQEWLKLDAALRAARAAVEAARKGEG